MFVVLFALRLLFTIDLILSSFRVCSVYVFLGTPGALIDMMSAMQGLQLFDNGEYMVIYVDMMTYSMREATKYLWSK